MTMTLIDVLQEHAKQDPDRLAYTFLTDGERATVDLTYGELNRRARLIAIELLKTETPGSRAVLLFPPGLDFIVAFLGCLYAGVVAVPAYPPQRPRSFPKFLSILHDASPSIALSTARMRTAIDRPVHRLRDEQGMDDGSQQTLHALRWLAIDHLPSEANESLNRVTVSLDSLAFLQYTSGSTGHPKGVMVTHGNLMANQRVIQQAFGHDDETIVIGWLPLYHDMGLIGNVLQPLYLGTHCVLMAPHHFLQKPIRWLDAITRYRATTSGGPNFAYDLCVKQISQEQREGLDLECWKIAFNGAEPIRPATLDNFESAFKHCGFRRSTFYPCYGLAESTLMVSGGEPEADPVLEAVQTVFLDQPAVIVYPRREHDHPQVIGCGHAYPGHYIVIVEPERREICAEGYIGEVWVQGPSVAQGYWNWPEESVATFQAKLSSGEWPFLRTGDLGFLHQGNLFITGRLKDLMIIRGRNHYPHDLEWTVSRSHPALRDGSGAVFSIDVEDEERAVVVQEMNARVKCDIQEVATAIRTAVADAHEVQVYAIALIKPGHLPKTSSGKVQRYLARDRFLGRELDLIGESVLEATAVRNSPNDSCIDIEAMLVRVWQEVFDGSTIDRESHFFALGGDSLRGTQVLARIQELWSVELLLEDLFEHPTLAELATCIADASAVTENSESLSSMVSAASPEPHEHLPLSFAQHRLWFLAELAPESASYHLPIALKLTGDLKVSALEESFREILRRHAILRTTFPAVNGMPVQMIHESTQLVIDITDLTGMNEEQQNATLERMLTEEARQPFHLSQGPLCRMKLFQITDEVHVLVVTMHHIIADGWSMGVLVRELTYLYTSQVKGQAPSLPTLPVQYVDFARWQRRRVQEGVLNASLGYWQEQLRGAPEILNVPTDYPRPVVQQYRGAKQEFAIPAHMLTAIRDMSQRQGVTIFMILLAAFKILLARYSGQTDFVVGAPVANRTRVELEGLIGCFVNTLALRTDLSEDPIVSALLARVKETVTTAQAHQAVPFDQVVEAVQPTRVLSHSPLFQVMLAFQNMPLNELDLPGLSVEQLSVESGAAQCDLNVAFSETTEGLSSVWEYSLDLFAPSTIARMAAHYQQVLHGMLANPMERISGIPLLTEPEYAQILNRWNSTVRVWEDKAQSVVELFEAQVARTPEEVAVVFQDQQVTYAELNVRADQLAETLRTKGVGPEVLVGIYMERSVDMVVGLLSVWKAGGAYVPLDPSYPKERMAFILEDAHPVVLLTQQALRQVVPPVPAYVLCLDEDSDSCPEPCHEARYPRLKTQLHPLQAAYMIYTSGSTGRPKGVVISHEALSNHMQWYQAALPLIPADRVPQKYSLSFDVGTLEIVAPLLAGARLNIFPSTFPFDAQELAEFLFRQDVTVIDLVPSVLRVLLDEPMFVKGQSLRRIICGGEALSVELQTRVWQTFDQDLELYNLYGPTETTMDSTVWACRRDGNQSTVPIGQPIANTQTYVLDASFQPVPIGVSGELYIGGEGLARGYWHRPELTAERFVPNPFTQNPGARLYKTGDRVRFLADGNLEYQGRVDQQVKVRGFRIEVGEIEASLARYPSVEACAVVASDDETLQKQLIAYVKPTAGIPEIWPSVGEYPVYDAMMYFAMTHDERRNRAYRKAIEQVVPGKTVVDLGTGADVALARMCIEAGAERVYAIEMLENAYNHARDLIERTGLTEKITLIQGDATHVQLPECVDVCVSELLGHIASSEGVVRILNDARRFLKKDGVMIPHWSATNIAAVTLPESLATQPRFSELTWPYVERIFEWIGAPFDVRVGIKNFPRTHVLSDIRLFEDLVFTGPIDLRSETKFTLTIQREGRVDGFLLWLAFSTIEGQVNDILSWGNNQGNWIPIFFPAFSPGVEVQKGDRIEAVGYRLAEEHAMYPNYRLEGRLIRKSGSQIVFEYDSFYQAPVFRHTPFYQQLFPEELSKVDLMPVAKDLRGELKGYLEQRLPEYMVPTHFFILDYLPLTPSGKVDRQALPAYDVSQRASAVEHVVPRTNVEQVIAEVWRDLLHVRDIGIHDNFFDLGGNSLLLTQVKSQLQRVLHRDIAVMNFFQYPTISGLAEFLTKSDVQRSSEKDHDDVAQRIDSGKHRLMQQRTRRQTQSLREQEGSVR
ncbi:MAG: hypothetical protein NPIRA02_35360 [Nitrospirales bacterium]|nr:MAG: hypothetical protein NPIRA02_35360 [Nitrospirales bacterium]